MEILIILGIIFLYFKYKDTQKSNAAFKRAQTRHNDEYYFEKVQRQQEDNNLEKATLELLSLVKEGRITQEQFEQGIEKIQNWRQILDTKLPHKFTPEELEEMSNEAKYLERMLK